MRIIGHPDKTECFSIPAEKQCQVKTRAKLPKSVEAGGNRVDEGVRSRWNGSQVMGGRGLRFADRDHSGPQVL